MKQLYKTLLIFILLSQICSAQKTYKVNEGDLQFINRKEGIILKKDNEFLKLEIFADADTEKRNIEFRPNITKITAQEYADYKNDKENIFAEDIILNYDFNKVKKIKFVSIEEDEDENPHVSRYEFLQYNNDIFANYKIEWNENTKKFDADSGNHSLFCFLNFSDGKTILMTFGDTESYIIPTRQQLKLFTRYDFDFYKVVIKEKQLSNKKNWYISSSNPKNEAYIVDTLPNGKLQLVNYVNTKVIDKNFDKIELGHFIIGYNKEEIDLYNYQFKKYNIKNIRAVKPNNDFPFIKLLYGNKIKKIGLDGKKPKKQEKFIIAGPPQIDMDSSLPVFVEIKNGNLRWACFGEKILPLINTENIEKFYFQSNKQEDYLSVSGNLNRGIENTIIYYKTKSGKYGINFLGYFINSNFEKVNMQKYQDLDQIIGYSEKGKSNLKLLKNGLFMYFPLQEDFKYKKLGDFYYDFVRFELPNGKKGWLDLEGNEYIDN